MKVAFVFPGQGSQSTGMLKALAAVFPQVEKTFAEASAVLGYDLWELVQQNPDQRLDQTEITQPALLTAGVAIWRCWQDLQGPKPIVMAGHSLGEFTALVCAEAFSFADGVRLVAFRGRVMQQAVPAGAMAAIVGLDDAAVEALCAQVANGQIIKPANYNAPGQVVVSGEKAAVERCLQEAKHQGAKIAKLLAVSVASHSALMQSAAEALQKMLETVTLQTPLIPVVHNADAEVHKDPASIRKILVQQTIAPVQWVKVVQRIQAYGVNALVECGPGKVLTGLNKRILEGVNLYTTDTPEPLKGAVEAVGCP